MPRGGARASQGHLGDRGRPRRDRRARRRRSAAKAEAHRQPGGRQRARQLRRLSSAQFPLYDASAGRRQTLRTPSCPEQQRQLAAETCQAVLSQRVSPPHGRQTADETNAQAALANKGAGPFTRALNQTYNRSCRSTRSLHGFQLKSQSSTAPQTTNRPPSQRPSRRPASTNSQTTGSPRQPAAQSQRPNPTSSHSQRPKPTSRVWQRGVASRDHPHLARAPPPKKQGQQAREDTAATPTRVKAAGNMRTGPHPSGPIAPSGRPQTRVQQKTNKRKPQRTDYQSFKD